MEMDFAYNTRLYLGLYEIELGRFFRRMLAPGATVLDVGAQIGYSALLFAKLTGGRVVTFDPDPECVAIARHNVSLNPGLPSSIEVVERAVGDGPGELGIDEFVYGQDGFIPDFVKVDVDGGEVSVLRSARRMLTERRPCLVVETHSHELEAECGRLLTEHGYRPVIVNQRRILPDSREIELNRWLICDASVIV